MSTRTSENMRRFRRRTVRILVDYQTEEGVHCDYATTLGAGGLFIETDKPLLRGTKVKLRFRLPGSEELHEIAGRVAWSRNQSNPGEELHAPGIGIQFIDTAGSSKLARELEDLE